MVRGVLQKQELSLQTPALKEQAEMFKAHPEPAVTLASLVEL